MTQALNGAAVGGGATAINNAQVIRQRRTLRRSGLRSSDWTISFPRIMSLDLTFRPTDNVSESTVMCGHISISLRATRRGCADDADSDQGTTSQPLATVPGAGHVVATKLCVEPRSKLVKRFMCSTHLLPP